MMTKRRKWYGWTGTILEVDLTTERSYKAELPERLAHSYLGQAGINARMLYDRVSAETDPLSPEAPLIFGVGPLGGTLAPCSGQAIGHLQVPPYRDLRRFQLRRPLGVRAEDGRIRPYRHHGEGEAPGLSLDRQRPGPDPGRASLWGKSTWETDELVREDVKEKTAQVACIGPAGENLVQVCRHHLQQGTCGCPLRSGRRHGIQES